MIAYLDSSVILRIVLGQPDRLLEWAAVRSGVVSGLVEVECLRTLDRRRLRSAITDEDHARRRQAVFALLRETIVVLPTRAVLARASQPLPTPLGTLDAVHLATALLYRETRGIELVVATHDIALGLGARASGFQVVGV